MAIVAGEDLVAAIADKRDGDVAPCLAADQVCRQGAGVGEGLIILRDDCVNGIGDVRSYRQFGVVSVAVGGDPAGGTAFIEDGRVETSGESLEAAGSAGGV